jgi:CheY-like chemotaxis protein
MLTTRPDPLSKNIWIAEDDDDHFFLVQKIFNDSARPATLQRSVDGEELLEHLAKAHAGDIEKPCLIILDVNMPRKDGWEALREIKADPNWRQTPVIVLSTSDVEEDKLRGYELGANSYIRKPIDFKKWVDVINAINLYWFGTVELPEKGEEYDE